MSAPAAFPDFAGLRRCWHPVCYSSKLDGDPLPVDLLGEPVVVYRGSSGAAHALTDVCAHRGTALSLGHVVNGELRCPYHGWQYGSDGVCTWIPQRADASKVPGKARVASFQCQERYGIVWVTLEEPRWPLPDVPELEDSEWVRVETGPYSWAADASRQLENFTDFGHFPWVHPGLLGDPERPIVPDHTVETDGHVLRYEIVRPEATNSDDFPVFANPELETPERRSSYVLQLPYTIVLRLGWGGDEGMVYFFASQPVARDRCSGYLIIGRNYNLDQPDEVLKSFEDTIFNQDQRVVESQRPERVPFDLAAEMHLKFDAVAMSYRKAMREQRLATNAPVDANLS